VSAYESSAQELVAAGDSTQTEIKAPRATIFTARYSEHGARRGGRIRGVRDG